MTPQQPFASPNPGVPPAMPPAPGPVPPATNPYPAQPQTDPFANANSIQMAPEPVFQAPVAQPMPVAPVASAQPMPVAAPVMAAQPAPMPAPAPVAVDPNLIAQPMPAAPAMQATPAQPITPAPAPMVSAQPVPAPVDQAPVAQPMPATPVASAQPMPVAAPPVEPSAVPQSAPIDPTATPQPIPMEPVATEALTATPAPVDPAMASAQPIPVDPATANLQPAPVNPTVAPQPIPLDPMVAPAPTDQMTPTQPAPIEEATPAQLVPTDEVAPAQPIPIDEAAPAEAAPISPEADTQPMMGAQDIPEFEPVNPEADANQPMGAVDIDAEMAATEETPTETEPASKPTPPIAPTIAQGPTSQFENSISEAPAAMPPIGLAPEPIRRRGKLPLIIGIILVLLIAAGVAAYFIFFNKKLEIAILDDVAVFLPESLADGAKSAVFNYKTGEKLTEFEYTYNSRFAGGYAAVTNGDGKDAIVNNAGKIIVGYDAFDNIDACGPLYVAQKGDSKTLINAMGKKVIDLQESNQTFCPVSGGGFFMVVRHDGKQNDIYNIHGQKVDSFETDKDILFRIGNSITSISHAGKIITLDNKELVVLSKYEGDSEKNFGLHDVRGKSSAMIISAGQTKQDEEDNGSIEYGVIAGDKIFDYSDKCEDIFFYEDSNVILCQNYTENFDLESSFMVREDGSLEELNRDSSYHFITNSDFVKVNYGTNSDTVEFYKDNAVVKTLTGNFWQIQFYKNNTSISDYSAKKVALYDSVGEKIIEIGQTRGSITGPYDGDVYLVDGADGSYLYSKEGKRLSRTFSLILPNDCNSFVTRQYGSYGYSPDNQLLNGQGVEVTKASEYDSFWCLDNGNILATTKNKKNFDVLGTDYAKLASGEYGNYVSGALGYIRAEFDSPKKIVCYTLDGVKFHEYGE